MSVYEALVLMIAFASLVLAIRNSNDKQEK
ncbi:MULTISPECIES: putative holin-like toxin [unclassified Listeria]|nr:MULTISPECIES: putative holin-like toxin [unclassified Listeria]